MKWYNRTETAVVTYIIMIIVIILLSIALTALPIVVGGFVLQYFGVL